MKIQSSLHIAGNVTSPRPIDSSTQEARASTNDRKVDEQPVYDHHKVEEATQKIQEHTQTKAGDIQFSLDQGTGKTVVKVVDAATKDVLMQFPSKQALAIAS